MSKRSIQILLLVAFLLVGVSCQRKRAAAPAPQPPSPPLESLFVLLPHDTGRPGGVTITNLAGSRDFTAPYTAIRVARNDTIPRDPVPIDPNEVRQVFGTVLDVLPAEQQSFNLYFALGAATLTPESETALIAILQTVRDRRSTLVTVTGHTDTTGVSRQTNFELGLQRAELVAQRLRAIGISPEMLVIRSHGQDDPLVATPPNTDEPRNRRVEIIVR